MKKERYRVLLICKKCDKVYRGTGFMSYSKAINIYYNTSVQCKDVCKNKECKEPLVPEIQDMEKPPEKKKYDKNS